MPFPRKPVLDLYFRFPRSVELDSGYNRSYTHIMKTAISIPDDLFEAAERLAKQLSMSRSELYAKALDVYLESRGGENLTERLDQVYERESSSVDLVLAKIQTLSVPREKW